MCCTVPSAPMANHSAVPLLFMAVAIRNAGVSGGSGVSPLPPRVTLSSSLSMLTVAPPQLSLWPPEYW